jgi:hypothetical protein
MARQAVTRRMRVAGLAGGALSVRAWLLLAAGTAGGLAFTGIYLAEGATRTGMRRWRSRSARSAWARADGCSR